MPSATTTSDELCRRLATNARRLRTSAELTVKQAAARGNLHWRHWQKVEAGKNNSTLATIVRMAAALGVTPAELMAEPPPGSGDAAEA